MILTMEFTVFIIIDITILLRLCHLLPLSEVFFPPHPRIYNGVLYFVLKPRHCFFISSVSHVDAIPKFESHPNIVYFLEAKRSAVDILANFTDRT